MIALILPTLVLSYCEPEQQCKVTYYNGLLPGGRNCQPGFERDTYDKQIGLCYVVATAPFEEQRESFDCIDNRVTHNEYNRNQCRGIPTKSTTFDERGCNGGGMRIICPRPKSKSSTGLIVGITVGSLSVVAITLFVLRKRLFVSKRTEQLIQ